ncbi:divergent protein kinase domain 2B [Latimeria chalumnae]|uniref:divergent protein kinase domain 2B n=1 Tax=Latimeria chalumnae TaxID=7897 RepID=UPI0003C16847|nr:PREDICTED: deleted in autism-related protein 1 [Latimeria chalumnae]|eukprot:XP_006001389.1 PREDICTED: deleted in autism-related protein 1 [Latimeria chalumnae]
MGSWKSWWFDSVALVLAQFFVLHNDWFSDATTPPVPVLVSQVKTSYSFGKTFLGLDKCNACIGTSICKKFFKEEIRFENWLSPHLKLPPNYKKSYLGNYTNDAESWRPVIISRLLTKYQHELSDKKICTFLTKKKACSIENALRKTERFQKLVKADRLTPELVQGLSTPLMRCPSQRLLDRIVRRYAEVGDAGSIYMKHFLEKDKLRLLYTLSINTHPVVLQIFPQGEGWPFPRYLGSCGRLIVTISTKPIKQFYNSLSGVAADVAYQLLYVTNALRTNDFRYFIYYNSVHEDMFGIFEDGHLFIADASTLGVIDRQEGYPPMNRQPKQKDIFSCLASDCDADLPSCDSVSEAQSFVMVCRDILPKLLAGKFLESPQKKLDRFLKLCSDGSLPDQEVIQAAIGIMDVLKMLRPCDPRFGYRYPECKYNQEH